MNWHDYFTYDAKSGSLIWKERPIEHFASRRTFLAWNAKHAGTVAGSPRHLLYTRVRVDNKRLDAHRIIWEMHNGPIVEGMEIDHINGIKCDNRLSNLRACTHSENIKNSILRSSLSGYRGVVRRSNGKYQAMITKNGKSIYIGTYESAELAHAAYKDAEDKNFGSPTRIGELQSEVAKLRALVQGILDLSFHDSACSVGMGRNCDCMKSVIDERAKEHGFVPTNTKEDNG